MKQQSIAMKTMAMKARVANMIRTAFYNKQLTQITEKEKDELFAKIYAANHAMHWELNAYKQKRQDKAEIQKLRDERGYKPKKRKTSKAQYEQSKKVA